MLLTSATVVGAILARLLAPWLAIAVTAISTADAVYTLIAWAAVVVNAALRAILAAIESCLAALACTVSAGWIAIIGTA